MTVDTGWMGSCKGEKFTSHYILFCSNIVLQICITYWKLNKGTGWLYISSLSFPISSLLFPVRFPPIPSTSQSLHLPRPKTGKLLNSGQTPSQELCPRRDAKWDQEVFQGHTHDRANPKRQGTLHLCRRSQLETTNALPSHLLEAYRSNILTSESTSQFFPKQVYHTRIYPKEI